jgi:hypothetical protein
MTYDADAPTTVLEFEHLRSQRRRRQTERNTSNQAMTLAIKMLIGDWRVDELGIMTREITARDWRCCEGLPAGAGNEARKQLLERVGRTPGNSLAFIVACCGRADHEVESVRGRNVLSVSPVVGCCVGPCASTTTTDTA